MAQPIQNVFTHQSPNQPSTPQVNIIGENGPQQQAQTNSRTIGAMEEKLDTRGQGMPRAREIAAQTAKGAWVDTTA